VVLDDEDNNEVLQLIQGKVENMKELMPILSALCNKNLKDKHWVQILELIEGGTALLGKQFINFQELIGLNVKAHFDRIEEISARATGEFSIEQDLEKIKREWMDTSLALVPYREFKDKFVLSGVADLFERLDDHLLKIQSMLSSKFAVEIRETLQSWERRLSLLHETLEEWLLFQQQWMYLENVFSAEDIQRQLPSEYSKFFAMDKFWKETMLKVQKKPGILDNVSGPELLARFTESNKQMEIIQRMLEDYLELKRKLFPRFYFLSNDDLLEIFSQTRNPEAIQPHLRKCFDNLKSIQFAESEGEKETIVAMVSAEPEADKEVVEFQTPVIARGPIEMWLKQIEEAMQKTLFEHLAAFVRHMEQREDIIDFGEAFKHPAQISLVLNMIRWTSFVEFHMTEGSLKELHGGIQAQILKSVDLIKSDLTVGQRELVKNMIINDVHNRDIVEFVQRTKTAITDFNWNKQFKYYWTTPPDRESGSGHDLPVNSSRNSLQNDARQPQKSAKNCFIGQTNTLIAYGFEYLGNSPRLVITPLTDKCYLTLTSALHLTYGGAPAGPAGTGKTETTKDLAKAVAIVCIVFNCSDSLEYKTMGRFFSGLAQCGAWACFDEFNRIDVEVLSVIAQQIMVIQNAMREKREEFDFEGKIIPLNSKFGVFITMNPGYAGRSELPDNLKALFRPVAMMIPDYALIAEIMLFSEGFQGAKEFGKKLVQLFKLSSEQLSKQKHYDFGMRAVKAVLNMAGLSRRADPAADENDILLKSMRDSNLPKFLLPDIGLFEGIIKDLFPGKIVESQDYPSLVSACSEYLNARNLEVGANLVTKIKQLYEVSNIRHGVMTVGNASSGKRRRWSVWSTDSARQGRAWKSTK
jgi:dynein heavy chain